MTVNIYDMAQTWDNGATDFTAIKMNVTDTASAATSKLLDLQVGGSSSLTATKNFDLYLRGLTGVRFHAVNASTLDVYTAGTSHVCRWNSSLFSIVNAIGIGVAASSPNVFLYRDADNTLALRNAANAQAFNIYNTYTNSSNYERVTFGWSGNIFSISPNADGTGSTRVIHLSGLPTSNPGPGILWNNAGTPAIGT